MGISGWPKAYINLVRALLPSVFCEQHFSVGFMPFRAFCAAYMPSPPIPSTCMRPHAECTYRGHGDTKLGLLQHQTVSEEDIPAHRRGKASCRSNSFPYVSISMPCLAYQRSDSAPVHSCPHQLFHSALFSQHLLLFYQSLYTAFELPYSVVQVSRLQFWISLSISVSLTSITCKGPAKWSSHSGADDGNTQKLNTNTLKTLH